MDFPSADTWANALTNSLLSKISRGKATDYGKFNSDALTGAHAAQRRVHQLARQLPFWRWVDAVGITVDRRAKFSYHNYEWMKPVYAALPADEAAWPEFSLTIQKSAQSGASIFALLMPLYLSARLTGFPRSVHG